ncbi:SGNH/GDSL hydrolase family protein [Scopulibacillus darangshiensis]|nr:SGNH/GDSL hydrolase family protein [Scopulibacillus darangshiensis]
MKIVCFGDSVTRGISFVRGRIRILKENYPALLQKKLGSEHNVINKGVFNDNSDLLLSRLDKDVLSLKPQVVLIHIGGNDCNFHWDQVESCPEEDHAAIVPLERYINNIKKMAERIKAAGAEPVLFTLVPIDPARYYKYLMTMYKSAIAHWIGLCGGIGYWHGLYNRALNEWITSSGIRSIDIRNAFKGKADLNDLINDDGIHPSAEGYSAIADIVADQLRLLKIEPVQQ